VSEYVRKAIIPAAGLGTRFYPLTRAQPKEMLPILDKPIIHYVVEEAANSGLTQILIVVGMGKEAIVNYFDRSSLDERFGDDFLGNLPDIYFVRQRRALGLGDAIRTARYFVDDDPFAILLGDTIYETKAKGTVTSQLLSVYNKYRAPCITVEEVSKDKIKDYGIIDGAEIEAGIYRIRGIVEKPEPADAPSNLGATGLYVLDSEIFRYLEKIRPGKNNEIQLTDALNLMAKERELFAHIMNGTRYDIGTKELWVRTFIEFARRDSRFSKFG